MANSPSSLSTEHSDRRPASKDFAGEEFASEKFASEEFAGQTTFWNIERTLYVLALLLALAVRLYRLGSAPLTDAEASLALQAWELARGSPDPNWIMASSATYITLSGLLMTLLGNGDFWARFWPAIAGASLALLPYFYRNLFGRSAALLLAFALALDPAVVTLSRQIGSPLLSLTLICWGLTALRERWPILSGLAWGAALLSGPAFWHGLSILGLTMLAFRIYQRLPGRTQPGGNWFVSPAKEPLFWRKTLLAGLIAWLAFGSAFFLEPQGLAAPFSALAEYLQSWTGSGTPVLRLLGTLLVYEILPLALVLIMLSRQAWETPDLSPENSNAANPRQPWQRVVALTWLSSLIITLLWPGRQTADLLWSVIPLWILACQELQTFFPRRPLPWISPIQAVLIALLIIMLWNALLSTAQIANLTPLNAMGLKLALVLGISILAVLTTLLVSLGWSWEASRYGLAWGLGITLCLYTLSAMWSAAHLRQHQPQELWSESSGGHQASLFQQTLHDLSSWNRGMPGYLDILSTVDAPSLRWTLRNHPNARFASQPPGGERPDIIITRSETPQLAAAYRGQDFVWWLQPGWSGALPQDLFNWLTFRLAPVENVKIILWARSDLFPGGSAFSPNLPTDAEPAQEVPLEKMK